MNHANLTASAAAVAASLLLSACAGPTQTTLPDGSIAYQIDCSGAASSLNYCFERAGKSCGAEGYTIVDTDGRAIMNSDVAETGADARVREYAMGQNSILVKCGN